MKTNAKSTGTTSNKANLNKTPKVKQRKSMYDDAGIPELTKEEEQEVIAVVFQRQDYYACKNFDDYWE